MKTLVFIENRDFFGNRLCHLPLLHALRGARAGGRVVVLSPYEGARLFTDLGLADAVEVYGRGFMEPFRLLRRHRADAVLTLRPASQRITAAVALARPPLAVGFQAFPGGLLLDATVPGGAEGYRATKFLGLLEPLGIEGRLDAVFVELAARSALDLPGGRPRICLMPGGGAGPFKRWGLDRFLELCAEVRSRRPGARFVFVLGGEEERYRGPIEESPVAASSTVLFDRSIPDLASACADSDVVVANDCGPSHVAQMLGGPYVGLYSDHDGKAASRLAEWFLPSPEARAVVGEQGASITDIAVGRVLEEVEQLLPEGG